MNKISFVLTLVTIFTLVIIILVLLFKPITIKEKWFCDCQEKQKVDSLMEYEMSLFLSIPDSTEKIFKIIYSEHLKKIVLRLIIVEE